MINWLFQRLTPAKRTESRWAELASTLESIWEEFIDPRISRVERLRSSYLADSDDLARKLREMGDYFSYDMPREEDKPIALAWRRLELQYKDLELILSSVFRRNYQQLPVVWFPLFAPKDAPYGSYFVVAEGDQTSKNIPPEGMFLTSRGCLGVDFGHLHGMGLSMAAFRERAVHLVKRTKPLHIVYDGIVWFIYFYLPFEVDFTVSWESEGSVIFLFGTTGSRFDFTPDAERALDTDILGFKQSVENTIRVDFIPDYYRGWRLDMFLPEGFLEELACLDFVLPGYEGMQLSPLSFVIYEVERRINLFPRLDVECGESSKDITMLSVAYAINARLGKCHVETVNEVPFEEGYIQLDQHPSFDDVAADFSPLDYPYGGTIHAC